MTIDVQCGQCNRTLDLQYEALYCRSCDEYFCERDYDADHAQHDEDFEEDFNWALALME